MLLYLERIFMFKKNNGFVVGGMYSCVAFETLCYTLLLLDINLFYFLPFLFSFSVWGLVDRRSSSSSPLTWRFLSVYL